MLYLGLQEVFARERGQGPGGMYECGTAGDDVPGAGAAGRELAESPDTDDM